MAVGLYLAGLYLDSGATSSMWFLYFGAWIFVIVALGGRRVDGRYAGRARTPGGAAEAVRCRLRLADGDVRR